MTAKTHGASVRTASAMGVAQSQAQRRRTRISPLRDGVAWYGLYYLHVGIVAEAGGVYGGSGE
jgi:hypothetical protein